MRAFKKEIKGEALLSLVLDTADNIKDKDDSKYIVQHIEKMCVIAFSAEWAIVWFKDMQKDILYSQTIDKSKRIEIGIKNGLIGKCYSKKKAILFKHAVIERDYNSTVDNALDVDQKDIILSPILSKDGDVLAILQISNSIKDIQQFTGADLGKLGVINTHITPILKLIQNGTLDNTTQNHNPTNFNNKLEDTIAQLTIEKEQAERAMVSSTRFLAEVAHEIRTPMNAVMGFLELLQIDETNEDKKLYLDTAIKSGAMMVALVNDLLDFAKIEQGMLELESLVFNPIEEYTSMGPLFSSRMKKSKLSFHTFIDPNMPIKIKSDPHRVKQILSNLIGNAVKFTPKDGEIALDIRYNKVDKSIQFNVIDTGRGIAKNKQKEIFEAFKQEKSSTAREYGGTGLGLSISQKLANLYGSTLQVESKEGKGSKFYFSMPLEDKIIDNAMIYDKSLYKNIEIKLIFKEICQTTSSILRKYFDAFSIPAQKIEELRDWESVETDTTHIFCGRDSLDKEAIQEMLNHGIIVTIMKDDVFKNYKEGLKGSIHELPCAFGPDKLYKVMFGRDLLREMNDSAEQTTLGLIVDDNSVNIQFLKAVLCRLGLKVESAEDGAKAVEAYCNAMESGNPYNIIFMDEHMPIMTGMEATNKILEIEKKMSYPHTPIIGLSGDSTEEHRTKSIEAGMDDSITKPVHVKDISNILKHFLDHE